VALHDPAAGRVGFRFRHDWEVFGEEADVLQGMAEQLPTLAEEMGADALWEWADSSWSGAFAVDDARETMVADFDRSLQTLYRAHVRSTIKRFETHLPLLPLEAAAGGLGPDLENRAGDWIEAEIPGRRGLSSDLFVLRIRGRSMERAEEGAGIPDGSLCVFRRYYGGTRKGKIMLVQRVATSESGGELTIKRYESEWEDGEQKRITMSPENPDFQSWELGSAEQWRSVAEFVCVLEN
jgi:SOS-response transcriptional repressor LexA